MATELFIKAWCDVCLTDDTERVEATVSEVVRVGGVTKRIELCDPHKAPLTALSELLERYGSAPDAKPTSEHARSAPALPGLSNNGGGPPSSQPIKCPLCSEVLKGRSSRNLHLKGRHNTDLVKLGLADDPAACPQCELVAASGVGLQVHMRTMHNAKLSRDKMAEARAAGKVYAARPQASVSDA